jgi:hypothetical protein
MMALVSGALQRQHLEHQHVIEWRPAAFCSARMRYRVLQIGTEQHEIDHRVQPLQTVTFGRELPQPVVGIEKSRLTPHLRPQHRPR